MISLKGISKAFGGHQALSEVTLTLPTGEIIGLLGPNGAGKTTLIRIIAGIYTADKGEMLIDGNANFIHESEVGYLPEERGLYKKMKVREQLIYLARIKGVKKAKAKMAIDQWLERMQLQDWTQHALEDLSKGMQQKVQFIAAVLHEPSLLILDEPFSGFDPLNAELLKIELISLKEKGTTIILSTHRMESVEELCDYVVMIDQSKILMNGSRMDIRERFRDNAYHIEYKGDLTGNWFEKRTESLNAFGNKEVIIEAKGITDSKDIMQKLINEPIDVVSFRQYHPSMHEVFVKMVKGSGNE